MLTVEELKKLTARALSFSKFPDCSVTITSTEEAYTRFANNGITMAGFSTRNAIVIQSTRDGKSGVAQIGETSGEALQAAVKRSEEMAALSPVNPEHLAPLGPRQYPRTNDYDEATARAQAPEILPRIRAAVKVAEKQKLVAAGLLDRTHSVTAIANKAGLYGFHRGADAEMSTTIRMPNGSSSGWAGHPATRIAEIDGAKLAGIASRKCLAWKNPKRLDPG
ncbi:MAG: PmbA/TldA family metallopeptidase, partial [Bryobacteraceae bacterium]